MQQDDLLYWQKHREGNLKQSQRNANSLYRQKLFRVQFILVVCIALRYIFEIYKRLKFAFGPGMQNIKNCSYEGEEMIGKVSNMAYIQKVTLYCSPNESVSGTVDLQCINEPYWHVSRVSAVYNRTHTKRHISVVQVSWAVPTLDKTKHSGIMK